ncbi:hypothetical protein ACLBOM_06730 [Escherichia coli]
MDINAGTIATGEETIEEVGWKVVPLYSCRQREEENLLGSNGPHNQLAFNPAPVTSFLSGMSLAQHGLSAMFLLFKAPTSINNAFALP